MSFEDLLVLSNLCLFSVVRPKECLMLRHGMGDPLLRCWVEGYASKEIFVRDTAVGVTVSLHGGRAILEKRHESREFDCTNKGYPGEDVPGLSCVPGC